MSKSGNFTVGFRKSVFGGYKPADVDDYVDRTEEEILCLKEENSSLRSKIQKFHEDEETIRKAIVSAQKLADSAVAEAKKQAEKISTETNSSIESQKLELKRLKTEVKNFKQKIVQMYQKEIRNLGNTNDFSPFAKNFNTDLFEQKVNSDFEVTKKDHFEEVFSESDLPAEEGQTSQTSLFGTKKLEFGDNYSPNNSEKESGGIFSGLFKNRKNRAL